MARQLKYADQRRSAVAVIEGGDERARGVVQLKDLALGARLAAEIETHDDWKAQPAQLEVPRATSSPRSAPCSPRRGPLMVTDRAYLKGARIGPPLARLDAEVARILAVLSSTGAMRVEPAALQPADVLLDLYGEDIRARAFVTRDEGAEMMLRPDFTVPIVRLHMDGAAPSPPATPTAARSGAGRSAAPTARASTSRPASRSSPPATPPPPTPR